MWRKRIRQSFDKIDDNFDALWQRSGVEEAYTKIVNEHLNTIAENLNAYNPDTTLLVEFKASLEMLAYTTTELLAQFCSGGFRWQLSDKDRFLSQTVDIEAVVRKRASEYYGLGLYYESIKWGIWDFLQVSEHTQAWFEALKLSKDQVSYLLWAAEKALRLLNSDERIPGFTQLALSNEQVLEAFCKCESPIESILFMQLCVDGLLPPVIQNQWQIGSYRVDFAIPKGRVVIECDGVKYHDKKIDAKRDYDLSQMDWVVLRFPAQIILFSPRECSDRVKREYPWAINQAKMKST